MLRNNRPYTNENGSVDDKLITDRPSQELKVISNWIKKNIVPSDTPYDGNNYSLKHLLEHDTGLYMTNNEFKDAMLLTGFLPVDPDALNWEYNIICFQEINMNPNPFFRWLLMYGDMLGDIGSAETDFIDAVESDRDFPSFVNHDLIRKYLEESDACEGILITFESLWEKFTKCNHEGCCHCCKNHTCNVNLKKTTYTTTRYDVGDGFYVEVSPNEKEESVEFYLGHNRYGVKDLVFGVMEKDCPKDDEKIQSMILQNVEDEIKIYKEEYFDCED